MSIWWSLHLPREVASVPLARRMLMNTMETAGVDAEISYELSIALSEACANAVEHGGDGDASGAYRVTALIDGDTCRIEVTDSGPGLSGAPGSPGEGVDWSLKPRTRQTRQPAPAHAEHGRGLFLIEALTDRVRYRGRPGCKGVVVSFDKVLKWRDDRLLKAS